MSLAQRIRKALAGPRMDADGWYRSEAPQLDPVWASHPIRLADTGDFWVAASRDRDLTARGCPRWERGALHEDHIWSGDEGRQHACPGWRGEP